MRVSCIERMGNTLACRVLLRRLTARWSGSKEGGGESSQGKKRLASLLTKVQWKP